MTMKKCSLKRHRWATFGSLAKLFMLVILAAVMGGPMVLAEYDKPYGDIILRVYRDGEQMPVQSSFATTVTLTSADWDAKWREVDLAMKYVSQFYFSDDYKIGNPGVGSKIVIDFGYTGITSAGLASNSYGQGSSYSDGQWTYYMTRAQHAIELSPTSIGATYDHPAIAGWNSVYNTMIHEVAHSFGFTASGFTGTYSYFNYRDEYWSNNYKSQLMDQYGTTRAKVLAGEADFDINGPIYFAGEYTKAVNHGNPVNVETNRPGSNYSHISKGNDVMAWVLGSDRTFFSEVELAMLKDSGMASIDLKKHFGYSEYRDGQNVTITGKHDIFTQSFATDGVLFDSDAISGVGLHVVGVYRGAGTELYTTTPDNTQGGTITLDASISAGGYGGQGIRIENNKNTVTINAGRTVSANGEYGVGVLVTRGSGTKLTNHGTITATGAEGRGVWFNDDATSFDNHGTINAGASNDAICIGSFVSVPTINFHGGTVVTGDITSANTYNAYATALNFGPGGSSTDTMSVTGDISGKFNIDVKAGKTTIGGTIASSVNSFKLTGGTLIAKSGVGLTSNVQLNQSGGTLDITGGVTLTAGYTLTNGAISLDLNGVSTIDTPYLSVTSGGMTITNSTFTMDHYNGLISSTEYLVITSTAGISGDFTGSTEFTTSMGAWSLVKDGTGYKLVFAGGSGERISGSVWDNHSEDGFFNTAGNWRSPTAEETGYDYVFRSGTHTVLGGNSDGDKIVLLSGKSMKVEDGTTTLQGETGTVALDMNNGSKVDAINGTLHISGKIAVGETTAGAAAKLNIHAGTNKTVAVTVGSLEVQSGSVLSLECQSGGAATLSVGGDATILGTASQGDGTTFAITGKLDVQSGGTFTKNGGTLTVGDLAISGRFTVRDGQLTVTNPTTHEILAGGLYDQHGGTGTAKTLKLTGAATQFLQTGGNYSATELDASGAGSGSAMVLAGGTTTFTTMNIGSDLRVNLGAGYTDPDSGVAKTGAGGTLIVDTLTGDGNNFTQTGGTLKAKQVLFTTGSLTQSDGVLDTTGAGGTVIDGNYDLSDDGTIRFALKQGSMTTAMLRINGTFDVAAANPFTLDFTDFNFANFATGNTLMFGDDEFDEFKLLLVSFGSAMFEDEENKPGMGFSDSGIDWSLVWGINSAYLQGLRPLGNESDVPEPATLVLMALAMLGLTVWRRKRG